jgi:hypothetical protein
MSIDQSTVPKTVVERNPLYAAPAVYELGVIRATTFGCCVTSLETIHGFKDTL